MNTNQVPRKFSVMFLEAEAPLVHGTSDIAKFPWSYRKTNPPSRMEIAKKYATDTRLAGAEEVNSDIFWYY